MNYLNLVNWFAFQTRRRLNYLFIGIVTGLLLVFLFKLVTVSYAYDSVPQKATFDPSQKTNRGIQVSPNAFRGKVRIYPNGGTPIKTPEQHPILMSSANVRDQLWVAGESSSWGHFQFWEKKEYQKPRIDPLLQVGSAQKPTKYTFACQFDELGAGVVAWGWWKIGSDPDACEGIKVNRKHQKKSSLENLISSENRSEKLLDSKKIIGNGDSISDAEITITRSKELTLVYIHELDGDVAVDVLVGAVQISTLNNPAIDVNAGNRYTYPDGIQTIEPVNVAQSPALQTFLDTANWSSEVAPLIDKLKSALSLSNSQSNSQPQLTQEQQEILDAHNRWRSQVNVPPLRWSKQLAEYAQEWANNLSAQGEAQLGHRPGGFSGAGENIAAGSSVTDMVDMWGSEGRDYDYATNSCRGDTCGHYTQVVWRNTTEVGCGVAPHRVYSKVLVCNYSPPGNYRGERPY